MKKEIKWSQWSPTEGMVRCGQRDYQTLMTWMRNLGRDAKSCLARNELPHAVYGMTVHEAGKLTEIRFYCDCYKTDDELDELARTHPHETIYAVHKSA